MWLVLAGVLLVVAKWASLGPVGGWSWWWVLAPFALAVAWWGWSDATGLTQRRAMDRMDAKKAERRRRNLEDLGLDTRRRPKK